MKKSIKLIDFLFVFLFLSLSISLVASAQLKVTVEHPFYINGKYIPAKNLEVGNTFQTLDGKTARITNIKLVEPKNPFFVYNLEVPFFNNFVVTLENLIVHNSNLDSDGFVTSSQNRKVNPSEVPDIKPDSSSLTVNNGRFNEGTLSLSEVAQLSPSQRLAYAERKLGTLTDSQKKGLMAAHYSEVEGTEEMRLLVKSRVLKESGFDGAQIDDLMRSGVAGHNLKVLRAEAGPEVAIHFSRTTESQSLGSGIPEPNSVSLYHATNELQLLYMQENGVRPYTFFGFDDPLANNENFARVVGDSISRNTGDAKQISNANEFIIRELVDSGRYTREQLETLVHNPVILRVKVPASNADDFIPHKLEHPSTTTEWTSKRAAAGEAEVLRLSPDDAKAAKAERKKIVREFADGVRPATEIVSLGTP